MKIKTACILFVAVAGVIFSSLMHEEIVYHPEFKEPHTSFGIEEALAYPPAVGILSSSKNCMSCHANDTPPSRDHAS